MAFMLAALIGFAIFEDAVDPMTLFRSGDKSALAWVALACVLAANLFALGLVLLLAGLRDLSLLTSGQARRGALARMAATNLMLLCFAFVGLEDQGAFSEDFYTEWCALVLLVIFVALARLSIMLFRSGWKHEARSAHQALASDPRSPVLYLRSFGIDDQVMMTSKGLGSRLGAVLAYTASVSPEQEMAFILERVGPVVAIGRPGERLPQLGAARLYVGDDEWRSVIGKLMAEAALVVVRAGETPNLWWEVEEVMKRCERERVIIVALGAVGTRDMFEQRFIQAFGRPAVRDPAGRSHALTPVLRLLMPYGRGVGKIIYFDRHGTPWEEPIRFRMTWTGFVLSPYRPYRDALQASFKEVFSHLGIAWRPKRSLTGAVLLALFGGIFGLHQFYLGHHRRGFCYLAFFWLAFPMVLGWIDAVRLALLDDGDFQNLVSIRTGAPEPT